MERKLEEYSQQLEEMVEHRTKQLKDTQERLVKSERLAAIGQVAAMVGHDLRNPLTGISGAAYYLKMKLGPKAEKKMFQMLEIIEKDVQYSNKIITDLMDYSKEIKLELTETTPKSIIAESISLIQIPEKVQLADSTLNEPKIKIDIDKMKRVFANFIKNAIEAMPQGGKLTISSRASSNNVEFRFIDSGVGMAKEVMEKIWTPFFTTKAKGMGLGLAICRCIIEAHQRKISVESIVGEGTTFMITIPLEPKPRVEGGEKIWVNMPESLLSTMTKA
jgi:signal transduction histidine kinase